MNKIKEIAVVTLVLIILTILICAVETGNQKRIKEWAETNGYRVEQCEQTMFDYGPFYYKDDGQMIYRVVLNNGEESRVAYFRIGLFFEQAWVEQ